MRNVIIAILCILFLFWLGVDIVLEVYYSSSLPKVSDVQTGHVYQMTVNHGFVVYATKEEFRLLDIDRRCFPLAGACCFALFVLHIISQRKSGSGHDANH